MTANEVILLFIGHLRKQGFPDLTVEAWPDEENRTTKDIDALAPPFAIEHTSIDRLPDQRGRDALFLDLIEGLAEKYASVISYRLVLSLPWADIRRFRNWRDTRQAIDEWIEVESAKLGDGPHRVDSYPGIPFPFVAYKHSDWPPVVRFYRAIPEDATFMARTADLVRQKSAKLKPYRDRFTTALLLESDDIALMNPEIVREAMSRMTRSSNPPIVDEIWYAETAIPSCCGFYRLYGAGITDRIWTPPASANLDRL